MIKTTNLNQSQIIKDIINLHLPAGIELDPTYSKGNFYKEIEQPKLKFDKFPQTSDTIESDASSLPLIENSINSIMFDPPFIVGMTTGKMTGKIAQRFHGFRYVTDLWDWYQKCLVEFHRILKNDGVLIIKCQDTVSSGKQWWSHVFLINEAEKLGFYTKDLFVLLASNRLIGHNHKNQKHARKFHSYFIVFSKK